MADSYTKTEIDEMLDKIRGGFRKTATVWAKPYIVITAVDLVIWATGRNCVYGTESKFFERQRNNANLVRLFADVRHEFPDHEDFCRLCDRSVIRRNQLTHAHSIDDLVSQADTSSDLLAEFPDLLQDTSDEYRILKVKDKFIAAARRLCTLARRRV